MKLVITPTAQQKLLDIFVYTNGRWGSKKAADYLRAIDTTIALIASPTSGNTSPAPIHHGSISTMAMNTGSSTGPRSQRFTSCAFFISAKSHPPLLGLRFP